MAPNTHLVTDDNDYNKMDVEKEEDIRSIHEAVEYTLNIDQTVEDGTIISLWFRTWGNRTKGIPVLFVHGGPGNCVDDYENINETFFPKELFYVIEIDQRGTGNSQPSVRDDYRNMKYYLDISIQQMADDFETIRKYLNINEWLVFGGSWGSTLSIEYGLRYPTKCLGLIIRGIFLNTREEFDAIYCRKSFLNNAKRLNEFDIFFELAEQEAKRIGMKAPLNPNDSETFIRLYESMILEGNKDAIWRFYAFECNLMEEDVTKLLYPYYDETKVDIDLYREALSVSFFEATLFLKGTFDEPINILSRLHSLKNIIGKVWVVQGTGDEVCPETFAQSLVTGLQDNAINHKAYFVAGGHKASSNGISQKLKVCVEEFYGELSQSSSRSEAATLSTTKAMDSIPMSSATNNTAPEEEGFLPLTHRVTLDYSDHDETMEIVQH